jgi:hypothetical protein
MLIAVGLAALAFGGCAGRTTVSSTANGGAHGDTHAPAFRVGQYCTPAGAVRYEAAGMACEHHHLVGR